MASRTCSAVAGGGALGVPREPTPFRLVEANMDIFVHLALDDTNSGRAQCLSYVGTEGAEPGPLGQERSYTPWFGA